jgi:DNA polymerase-3 subunit epsilon
MGFVKLINRLKKSPVERDEFFNLLKNCNRFFDNLELEYELLIANGFPIEEVDDKIYLKTSHTKIKDETFCIVDIETNGGKPQKSQIIEIGAIKIKNGLIEDSFETLLFAKDVPEYVTKVTELSAYDLKNAPLPQQVLTEFKTFLGDSVFVAHNVEFDYGFLSYHLNKHNLGELKNRKLCTIDLAKKTIESPRFGLGFLNDYLKINNPIHHRAYADVLTTFEVLKISLTKIPQDVVTTEDLLDFAKHNQQTRKKRKKEQER